VESSSGGYPAFGEGRKALAMSFGSMYDSYMRSKTYPLAMPQELMMELRETAAMTGLSVADTMRQSMKLGLPKLKAALSGQNQEELKPLSPEEAKECYGTPDPEWDALVAAAVKGQSFPKEDK
jgi:hypothetical protein